MDRMAGRICSFAARPRHPISAFRCHLFSARRLPRQQRQHTVVASATLRAAFPATLSSSTPCMHWRRGFSLSRELQLRVDAFQEQFAEARMCLDDAHESQDTSYFKDDIVDAKEAVDKCLELYSALLADADEASRDSIDNANGLKVRALKEEYEQLLKDDH
eukprot:TRINITY_DN35936_c0_g1_i1.p2 TRINITY_DN35936_c0_g1~~TRINITY_DN35936_c0_g1_i1.p2  ORF type:complete len:161 (-),score=41.07 TRINITY_DN35936_c0_g1_i1:55-537(-)